MMKLLAAIPSIKATEIGLPTSTANLGEALANGVKFLMIFVGMLAILFVIVGAFQLTYAQGVAARITRARETLLYAVVGLIVAIGAYALVSFVTHSINP